MALSRAKSAMALLLTLVLCLPLLAATQPAPAQPNLRAMADCCARMTRGCPPASTGEQRDCCQRRMTAPQPATLITAAGVHYAAAVIAPVATQAARLPARLQAERQPGGSSPPTSPPERSSSLRI